jgi:hypothetical protein
LGMRILMDDDSESDGAMRRWIMMPRRTLIEGAIGTQPFRTALPVLPQAGCLPFAGTPGWRPFTWRTDGTSPSRCTGAF